ncbi:MAG: biopolymer transporter ExbD [Planctomycetia bacterium]|nr:biopolymer transporter ExbD [Planctomycetia bacterium]
MAVVSSSYSDDDGDAPITEINVTPLVDIVLVLLIVFMITIPTIVAMDLLNERDLKIKLPRASAAVPLTFRVSDVIVNIEASGRYLVGGKEMAVEGLQAFIEQSEAANPQRVNVMIRADKHCPWEFVVSAINICNAVKVRSYSVTTLE